VGGWEVARSPADLEGPPAPGARPAITFRADGTLEGADACSRVTATWELHGTGLALDDLVWTDQTCTDEAAAAHARLRLVLEHVQAFQSGVDDEGERWLSLVPSTPETEDVGGPLVLQPT
jgi:heat shock protein HslJ